MNTFDSICSHLTPLEIYNIQEGTNVYNELASYSVALDVFKEVLDEMLRECFVCKAETYGLENRETVYGKVRENYSISDRQNMIIYRQTLGENHFNKEGLEKFLVSFGVESYQIIEMPTINQIAVFISGNYSAEDIDWIKNQVRLILPAHLDHSIDFNGIQWDYIDSTDLTSNDMDNRDYTWDFIHSLV